MKLFHIAVLTAVLSLIPAVSAQNSQALPSTPLVAARQKASQRQPASGTAAAVAAANSAPPLGQSPGIEPKPMMPPADSAPAAPATVVSPSPARAKAKPASTPQPASVTAEDEPVTTITKRVDEVNVIFTVTDKHGKFVKDLTEKDFQVRDDNKPPRQIVSFSRETNLPLRVGLLIDASSSIRDRFRFEQESAAEFLAQIIRPRSDLAFVIGFDTSPLVTADFTDHTEALARGINALRPGGGTAMYDAVYYACRDKLMKAPQNGPVRRALILISDGDDNQSRVTQEEAIQMAQRAEVIIYAISTNVSGIKMRGDKVLQRMADATGGRAFFPFKVQDVAKAFAQIQDELRSQYAIAYRPADFVPDGRFRTIQIVAENHKHLEVRARRGYFAPKH